MHRANRAAVPRGRQITGNDVQYVQVTISQRARQLKAAALP
jgi:hypothetical protein